jgi:3-oxoacyl-[acyl-carrier protein] reductase
MINYLLDPARTNAQRARELVESLGSRTKAVAGDVRTPTDCAEMVAAAVTQFGRLDLLINNTGVLRDRSVKTMTDADWPDGIDTNLTGVFNMCSAALPVLSDGGKIVNISSIAAAVGFFGQANCASAKAWVA